MKSQTRGGDMQPNPLGMRMFTYGFLFRGSKDLANNLDSFSVSLLDFVTHKMWQTGWWDEPSEKMLYAPSLSEFVERDVPDGLGQSIDWVYASLLGPSKINQKAAKALSAFDAAINVETGKSAKVVFDAEAIGAMQAHGPAAAHGEIGNGRSRGDNITSTDRGTDQTYTVRRLMRDAPELVELVRTGELSPHAAAIRAGFRRPTLTISDVPESAAASIRKKFGTDFAQALCEALSKLD
jgi:hypothetical protein